MPWRVTWSLILCLLLCPAPSRATPRHHGNGPAPPPPQSYIFGGRDDWPRCRTPRLPSARPRDVAMVSDLVPDLDAALRDMVQRKRTPSAALIVVRRGRVVYRRAFGTARVDTIYDLASVTKVVATTTAILQLVDAGKLALSHPIGRYLRWLGADKRRITVRQLLTHTAGLAPGVWRGPDTDTRKQIMKRIRKSRLRAAPGTKFKYSDLSFILLGAVVEKVSGMRLDRYLRKRVLAPLRMCTAGFAPPLRLKKRLVDPWPIKRWLGRRGLVYDPLSERLRGIAGHAGLYATLDDLARFGQALLQGGALGGKRILSRGAVRLLRKPIALPGGGYRGIGWRIDGWPGRRGLRYGGLSRASFGHTGFTGTSLWLDPKNQLVIALLTNRTRIEIRKDKHYSMAPLRRRVHQLVRGALLSKPHRPLRVGLDVLVAERFKRLRGRRVALVTNRTAVDRRGRFIADLVDGAPGVTLVSMFAPEHGLDANVERHIRDRRYRTRSGRRVPVYSLFGRRKRPSSRTLAGVDTIVFDIAAVGVRYYTYIATMGWAMREAARRKLRFVVLDRPNPIGGRVQGPLATLRPSTLTRYHPLPLRYGMTMGELALLFNKRRRINVKLEVVKVRGWRRRWRFDRQGLPWVNPSPNIRTWRQALAYGAVGMVEGTNVAVGRGTDSPFLWLGAPWIRGRRLARALNRRFDLPGAYFVAETRTPRASRHRGRRCGGVRLLLLDASRFRVARTAMAIALSLQRLYKGRWRTKQLYRMVGHQPTTRALLRGRSLRRVVATYRRGERRFRARMRRFLLYR